MKKSFIRLLAVFAMLALAGCASTVSTTRGGDDTYLSAGGHGGGVAIMRNGDYLTIGADGDITGRCYLCYSGNGKGEDCARAARERGVEVCSGSTEPAERASTSSPRGGLMCTTYGPNGPLPPVEYGTPGYTCYMTSPSSCTCFQN